MDWFSIHCTERDGVTVVRLCGELDVATAPLLREQINTLVSAGSSRLVLDLGDLDFLDASGLRVLLHAHRLTAREAGWARLARVRPMAQKVLRLVRLTRVLPAFDSLEQAVGEPPDAERDNYDAPA